MDNIGAVNQYRARGIGQGLPRGALRTCLGTTHWTLVRSFTCDKSLYSQQLDLYPWRKVSFHICLSPLKGKLSGLMSSKHLTDSL
ncbi:hypothetical protein GDO78_013217 [Eleutherodactylus coqui]|uniref:Uncharacterized protein n=1 Tax=Eleutherodactylus coqui TaxID=57060 RepID=A0A8J6F027_ELECQ|nr:hypothetical protein GDO78_013217 [Eleutherodactylus coqui]